MDLVICREVQQWQIVWEVSRECDESSAEINHSRHYCSITKAKVLLIYMIVFGITESHTHTHQTNTKGPYDGMLKSVVTPSYIRQVGPVEPAGQQTNTGFILVLQHDNQEATTGYFNSLWNQVDHTWPQVEQETHLGLEISVSPLSSNCDMTRGLDWGHKINWTSSRFF